MYAVIIVHRISASPPKIWYPTNTLLTDFGINIGDTLIIPAKLVDSDGEECVISFKVMDKIMKQNRHTKHWIVQLETERVAVFSEMEIK